MELIVCSHRQVAAICAQHRPSHALSLLSPGTDIADAPRAEQLSLSFHDISAPAEGLISPGPDMVEQLLAFCKNWNREGSMVLYCWAGISRSPAALFVLTCQLCPDIPERDIAESFREAAPWVTPNMLVVQLADDLLGRHGRMIAAVAAIGRGADAFEGKPVKLSIGDDRRSYQFSPLDQGAA